MHNYVAKEFVLKVRNPRKFCLWMPTSLMSSYAKENEKIADWLTFHGALLKKRTGYLFCVTKPPYITM